MSGMVWHWPSTHSCIYVLFVATVMVSVCCGSSEEIFSNRSKRGAALFLVEPIVGGTVSSAVDAYKEAKDSIYSKIYVEIINYSRWPLSQPEYKIGKGVTSQVPTIILSGYKEAFAGEQTLGSSGTEGVVAWDVSEDLFCAFYWSVPENFVWRDANQLGIGCTAYSDNITDFDELDNIAFMKYQSFGTSQKTMQYCEDHFCIQGIMSSSTKAEATFNFIPLKTANLSSTLSAEINQGMIDRILENSNSCKLGCGVGSMSPTVSVVFGLVFVLLSYNFLQ